MIGKSAVPESSGVNVSVPDVQKHVNSCSMCRHAHSSHTILGNKVVSSVQIDIHRCCEALGDQAAHLKL